MTRNPSRLLLTPLAFVSPRVIAAIVDGTAPADLTVTGLAKALRLMIPILIGQQENAIVVRLSRW